MDPQPQTTITLAPLMEAAAAARSRAAQLEAAGAAERARAEAYEDAARLIAEQAAPPPAEGPAEE